MDASPPIARRLSRPLRVVAAAALAATWLVASASVTRAAGLTLEAEALLAGHARVGGWTEIRVTVANEGPAVSGELRLATKRQGDSTYGTLVELPTTSRQTYTLYVQPSLFNRQVEVSLVAGGQALATTPVQLQTHDPSQPVIGVIAERPQGLVPDITTGTAAVANDTRPVVVPLTPTQLPSRVEAWSALDRLVWQDIDVRSGLSGDQLDALTGWLAAGGQLVIAGGTTGIGTVGGFPDEILPFRPSTTVDMQLTDLEGLLGTLPEGATPVPALAGTLQRGAVLARSGDFVVAAQASFGAGTVTILGLDPSTDWLAGTPRGVALWRRVLPGSAATGIGGPGNMDDTAILGALGNLPAVTLPTVEQLFLLLAAYIVLVGPINYLVLRRLDRRDWAWVTMPLLVVVFAIGSYALGASLRGSDIIVNQVAIVRAAPGTDRGLGQAYLGVFSPTRQQFEVRMPGGALMTNALSVQQQDAGQPLDALFGEPSRLRGFQVGFASLRSFRAEAPVTTPRVDSDLRLNGGHLQGTVTNASEVQLDEAAVVVGTAVARLGAFAPGESRQVDLELGRGGIDRTLSEQLLGSAFPPDRNASRILFTRRSVIDHLSGYGSKFGGSGALAAGPVLLGWRSAPAMEIELTGHLANEVGETLFMTPLPMRIAGDAVFAGELVRATVIEDNASQGFDEGAGYAMGEGTMTVQFRPVDLSTRFTPRSLGLMLSQSGVRPVGPGGTALEPLPDDEQPPQEAPEDARPGGVGGGLPSVQLYDHAAAKWVEMDPVREGVAYDVADPGRYVDETGALLVRFVSRLRGLDGESIYFLPLVRIHGAVE